MEIGQIEAFLAVGTFGGFSRMAQGTRLIPRRVPPDNVDIR